MLAISILLVHPKEPLAPDVGQDPRGPLWTRFLMTVRSLPPLPLLLLPLLPLQLLLLPQPQEKQPEQVGVVV